jgi:hypothetical protein
MSRTFLWTVSGIPSEQFRYRVRSASDPKKSYFVDLLENRGFGRCDCEDFICRRWPRWQKRESTRPCKHIIRCQIVAWRFISGKIIEQQEQRAKGHHIA